MPKSLSGDLRERVIEAVEAGASRREAAERDHGVCAPKPRGGSRSVLEDDAERILALIDEQPDRTLDELVVAMHKRRIPGSRSALWLFLDRHDARASALDSAVQGISAKGTESALVQTLDPTNYEPIANPVLIRVALKVQK